MLRKCFYILTQNITVVSLVIGKKKVAKDFYFNPFVLLFWLKQNQTYHVAIS